MKLRFQSFFEESFFILLLLLLRMFCAATFQTNECAIIFPQSNQLGHNVFIDSPINQFLPVAPFLFIIIHPPLCPTPPPQPPPLPRSCLCVLLVFRGNILVSSCPSVTQSHSHMSLHALNECCRRLRKALHSRRGPYQGLFLVESAYQHFYI